MIIQDETPLSDRFVPHPPMVLPDEETPLPAPGPDIFQRVRLMLEKAQAATRAGECIECGRPNLIHTPDCALALLLADMTVAGF